MLMRNPTLTREQVPPDQAATSPRLNSSCSQMYRLTIRPRPGTDSVRNLRAALKALGRRYSLDVIELRPIADKPHRRTSAALERRGI